MDQSRRTGAHVAPSSCYTSEHQAHLHVYIPAKATEETVIPVQPSPSLSPSLCFSLSVCLSVCPRFASLCLSLSLPLSVSLSRSLPLSLSLSVSLCLSPSFFLPLS